MFGIYTNKRISEAESNILYGNPDDYCWYMMYLNQLFNENRSFQVREDIKIPQNEDDNGVVLMFQGQNPVYFKTIDGDVTYEESMDVYNVCSYLEDLFKRPILAYVVFPSDCEIKYPEVPGEGEITIVYSCFKNDDGEKMIENLENKLINNEEFTVPDSTNHMFLAYSGFKNKEVFQKKYDHYMKLIEEYGSK